MKLVWLVFMLVFSTSIASADEFGAYDQIQCGGTNANRRGTIDFTDAGATCTDDSANNRTKISGLGGGASGDSVTVNTTAVDTTANLKDTSTVTWALVDGGAGGPDDAQATAIDLTCTNCIGDTEVSTNAGTSLSVDLEEEGAINATAVTGNATDTQLLIGTGVSTAAWATMGTDATISNTGALTISANAVALGTDTTNNYVATVADAGNSTITVSGSGSETAAVTLDAVDVNCTNCLGPTEISDLTLGTDTAGNYVATVADGTGVDGTASGEGATYTPTLDLTEISSTTWGTGAFTTMTFDAGTCDPRLTTADKTLTLGCVNGTNNESLTLDFDTTANTVDVSTATGVTDLTLATDLNLAKANANLTLQHTGGDVFGFHTEAGSVAYLNNSTDGVHYLHFGSDHTIDIGGAASGSTKALRTRITSSTGGNAGLLLDNDSVGIQELDAVDEPADNEVYSFDSATGRGQWDAAGSGSGFTTVGNCTTGTTAFDGSCGDTLTFNDADGDQTFKYNTSANDFEATDDLTIIDPSSNPHLQLCTASSAKCFELTSDSTFVYLTDVTTGTVLLKANSTGIVNYTGFPVRDYPFPAAALQPLEFAADSIPPITKNTGTNVDTLTVDFDDTTDECRQATLVVPPDVDPAGTVTFRVLWDDVSPTACGSACEVMWEVRTASRLPGDSWDKAALTTTAASAATVVNPTAKGLTSTAWTASVSALGMRAGDFFECEVCRNADNGSDDMVGDAQLHALVIEVPLTG